MRINYDKEKINAALKDFVRATGINIQFIRADLASQGLVSPQNKYCAEIQKTPCGINACAASDSRLLKLCGESRRPEMHICHAGLMDVAVPILYGGEIIGYLILGQMKTDTAFDKIEKYLTGIGADASVMKKHYSTLPVFDPDKMQSVARVAEMLAKFLLFQNMMQPRYNLNIQKAVEYINENLGSPLSVEQITKNGNISKNGLYRGFKKELGMTVSEYISVKRIERAEGLLVNTDMSVEEISSAVGFSSAAYFGANFKKLKGMSPLKFRKMRQNSEI